MRRPLLDAIEHDDPVPPVLLIDEIDRADDEFEAFLLELLSDFQVTIPEIGTIRARQRPVVVLTSNRTRELHDALKRRCLYHWIGHPALEREIAIVRARVPGVPERLAAEAAAFVEALRASDLAKVPGVAETIDWTQALVALGQEELEAGVVDATLGSVLKYHEDLERVRDRGLLELVAEAKRRSRERAAHRRGRRRDRAQARHVRPDPARGRARGRPRAPAGRPARAGRGAARQPRRGLPRAALHDRLAPRRPRGVRRGVRGVLGARPAPEVATARSDGARGAGDEQIPRVEGPQAAQRARPARRPTATAGAAPQRPCTRPTSCCARAIRPLRARRAAPARALVDRIAIARRPAARSATGPPATAAGSTCAARSAVDAHRRPAGRARVARAAAGAAPARLPGRRLGLDGAYARAMTMFLLAARARGAPRRGVHVRHPPDAAHAVPRPAATPIARSSGPREPCPTGPGARGSART